MASDDVSRTGRERRGARDGSDRVARIARWLGTPVKNPKVTELVLSLEDGDTLGRWARDEVEGCQDALAYRIDALLLDAANDQATTIGARLAWLTDEGVSWASKGFRARCEQVEQENIRPLDGSTQSWLSQAQRHNEAFAAQLAMVAQRSEERIERILGVQERIIESLASRLDFTESARRQAEEREQEALGLAERAAEQAEEAAADAAADAAAKDDTIGKVIDIAVKQLASGPK